VEGLIELVAASFARHGIDCPGADLRPARPLAAGSVEAMAKPMTNTVAQPVEASLSSVALPEHNFRKSQQGDPVP
jgi:hypothetical protein